MNLEGIMERHHADNLRPTDSSGKVHKDAMNSAMQTGMQANQELMNAIGKSEKRLRCC